MLTVALAVAAGRARHRGGAGLRAQGQQPGRRGHEGGHRAGRPAARSRQVPRCGQRSARTGCWSARDCRQRRCRPTRSRAVTPDLGGLVTSADVPSGQLLLRPMLVRRARSPGRRDSEGHGRGHHRRSACRRRSPATSQPGSQVAVFDTYAHQVALDVQATCDELASACRPAVPCTPGWCCPGWRCCRWERPRPAVRRTSARDVPARLGRAASRRRRRARCW